ncbi:TnpV protein [Oscillibacter sp. MSJ-31]|uniref:TnpV protein n=1 Tax=Oscillibacter sp. MSJ-31 TaxID=2841526 RepID=UPI0020A08DE6|nr:TnpV protein [Oscillibacter sp. MSJ-31]
MENRKERKMEITYSKYGDYYLPDLAILEEESATYGRFGRMRLKYLKEHHRATYINLKTSGQLTHHLNEIDHEANEMLRLLIEQMAQAQGVTEQLKEDQMAWVGAMNNIRSAEEEVVMQDVIFA